MHPSISIITPSFNQGCYIEATIRSVLDQGYANLEHIIVDGGSTDDTLEILSRYPHLKVISEPDRGQADAVNKGLRLASGDIIGWLNSDDTYYPGALADATSVISPENGVLIAMGRCTYIDEDGVETGREHPSKFDSHRRVVEIWKGYTIPNPAVFFHRNVYEECGGLDESLYFALDYDLFCRYTRRFTITTIDRVWATYRLHASAKTSEQGQGELLEKSLDVSRRYWGGTWSVEWWRYFVSFWIYGGQLGIASLKRLNLAERYLLSGSYLGFAGNLLAAVLIFPPQVFRSLILPRIKGWCP
ncbi:MAG: glycosyltransferase [Geobacteraceae bacterium]|nr:glycosyltransferase [Geobacteraceae bacterium]